MKTGFTEVGQKNSLLGYPIDNSFAHVVSFCSRGKGGWGLVGDPTLESIVVAVVRLAWFSMREAD